ncbi:class B sortase [Candidatus Saccharibacteria bacterium]|nr:class B sortase [Candidatus Saccharibacteria bacterium]
MVEYIVNMKIRRTKARVKLAASCIIALVCVVGIGVSLYKIIEWRLEGDSTKAQSAEAESLATVQEKDDDDVEIIENNEKEDSLYWKYLKTKLIDVDFTELKQKNSDTVGWIQVGGTNINYPFVQVSNNDYYLKHSFDKSYNSAGWVFADFRNRLDGQDKNLIIYAHGRYDGTMFGTLKNILTNGWLNDSNNFIVRTASEKESALWQVFSTYRTPVTSDYIQTDFATTDEFGDFTQMIKNRSAHNFNTSVTSADKILTLSTCYNDDRVVMHAKLIKRSVK